MFELKNPVIAFLGDWSEFVPEIEKANPKKLLLVSATSHDLPKISGEILHIESDPLKFSLQSHVDYLVINYWPKCGSKLAQLLWYNYRNVREKIIVNGTSYFWAKGNDPENSGDRPGLGDAVVDLSSLGYSYKQEGDSVTITMKKEMRKNINKGKGCGGCGNSALRERVKNALRR